MATGDDVRLAEHERRLNAINGDVRILADEIKRMRENAAEGHSRIGSQLAGMKVQLRVVSIVGGALLVATITELFRVFGA